MHQVKGPVDVFQTHGMGHHVIDVDLARQVVIHKARQLGASPNTAKGRATPDPAGDQLEWSCADFLTGARHTDDDGFTPALVTTLKGGAHDLGIANTLKGIVHAAIGQIDDHVLDGLVVFGWVDELGRTQHTRHLKLVLVQIHRDDTRGAGHDRALDHAQTDTTQTKHGHRGTGFDFGRVEHGADPGGNAAT